MTWVVLNLQVIFTIASVLGAVACLSSLLLLWACLDSGRPHSLFRRMHLPPIPYAKIITLIYLKVRSLEAQGHVDAHTPLLPPGESDEALQKSSGAAREMTHCLPQHIIQQSGVHRAA